MFKIWLLVFIIFLKCLQLIWEMFKILLLVFIISLQVFIIYLRNVKIYFLVFIISLQVFTIYLINVLDLIIKIYKFIMTQILLFYNFLESFYNLSDKFLKFNY